MRGITLAELAVYSNQLRKEKKVYVFLPPGYTPQHAGRYPLAVMNDGQDMEAMRVGETLQRLYDEGLIKKMVLAAVPANNRLREYGTAGIPDYANRGDKAGAYTAFIRHELVPWLRNSFGTSHLPAMNAIFGCSLGGLSAFDIAWHHPDMFARAGVFSGALWWRRHQENDNQADIDRIIHGKVRQGLKREGLKFWFQAGTLDETADRNNNGIIDAIDDTLDLMDELEKIGYSKEQDMRYLQMEGGKHDYGTWSEALPDFLTWAFSKNLENDAH